jgi:hypothetical protein
MERTSQQRTVNAWPKFFFELEGKSSDFCNFRNRIEKNKNHHLDVVLAVDDFFVVFSTLAETQRLDRLGSIRHRRFLRWNKKSIFSLPDVYDLSDQCLFIVNQNCFL